ncbi:enoyl-CoA hydratase-related protein [Sphingomonas sp. AOB5]|uniref:enoyl-CoA hydratase-related protein n=1 Tax=Sphingomonas sp. AOB5 TaxID=3034017 RepID=UPI0023F8F8C2|nr:enoyl-CoA hydratase-related protein [Sphingomonas sp. AOB5]MDF7774780.1 enoyl-CoA hydratase-related protein [Sphingomonas sp. AOB5]
MASAAKQEFEREDLILVRREDRPEGGYVAWVTINNEAKKNALPVEGRALLAKIMTELATEPELRCVVLTGHQNFIGGANIGQMADFPDHIIAEIGSKTTHHACDSIRRVPVPVIARIEGYCLGAGMEIATSCDMRVASTTAKFGMPEVKYGVPSGMEACLIPRLTGWGKAMELVFTGEIIDAAEAYHFNYVEKLVAPEELDAQTERWVKSICEAGPRAIRIQKALCRDWEQMSISDAVQAGIRAVGHAHTTDEPKRLMSAWRERQRLKREARGGGKG